MKHRWCCGFFSKKVSEQGGNNTEIILNSAKQLELGEPFMASYAPLKDVSLNTPVVAQEKRSQFNEATPITDPNAVRISKPKIIVTSLILLGVIAGEAYFIVTDKDGNNVPYIGGLGYLSGVAFEALIHQLPPRASFATNYLLLEHMPVISLLEAMAVNYIFGNWTSPNTLEFLAIFSSYYIGIIHTITAIRKLFNTTIKEEEIAEEKLPESWKEWFSNRKWQMGTLLLATGLVLTGRAGYNLFPKLLYGTISTFLSDLGLTTLGYHAGKWTAAKPWIAKYRETIKTVNNELFFALIAPGSQIEMLLLGYLLGFNRDDTKQRIKRRHKIISGDEEKILELHRRYPELFVEIKAVMNKFENSQTKNIIYNPDQRPINPGIKRAIILLIAVIGVWSLANGNYAEGFGAIFLLGTFFLAQNVEKNSYQEYRENQEYQKGNQTSFINKINWGLYYLLYENPRLISVAYGYVLQIWDELLFSPSQNARNYAQNQLFIFLATFNCVLVAMAVAWKYQTPYLGKILTELKEKLELASKNPQATVEIKEFSYHQLRLIVNILNFLEHEQKFESKERINVSYQETKNSPLQFSVIPTRGKKPEDNEAAKSAGRAAFFGPDLRRTTLEPLVRKLFRM